MISIRYIDMISIQYIDMISVRYIDMISIQYIDNLMIQYFSHPNTTRTIYRNLDQCPNKQWNHQLPG